MLASTAIYVSVDGQYYGAITFTDHIRPEAKQTMNQLKKLGVTINVNGRPSCYCR